MEPSKENLRGFPGVTYHKKSGKYLAFTIFEGKRHLGGLWDTFDQAVAARDRLRKKLGKE